MTHGYDVESPVPPLPEKRVQDKERIRGLGDLLLDVSSLIEALNTQHQADQIDHEMTFPILPLSPVQIPEIFSLNNPDYITITAGKTRVTAADGTKTIETYLSVDITSGDETLKITRDGTAGDDDDIIFDTTRHNSSKSLRDELRAETEDEFTQRLTPVPKVPREELNALLMSLAIPENREYSHFADKDLLDLDTFTYLIETLKLKAFESNSYGTYVSEDSSIEMGFEKKDNDESFTIAYTDPKTDRTMIVTADTQTGFDLRFATFEDGFRQEISPSNEDIALLQTIIHTELSAVTDTVVQAEVYDAPELGDPENIALNNVARRDARALERLRREVEWALDNDSFNPSNPGAA